MNHGKMFKLPTEAFETAGAQETVEDQQVEKLRVFVVLLFGIHMASLWPFLKFLSQYFT